MRSFLADFYGSSWSRLEIAFFCAPSIPEQLADLGLEGRSTTRRRKCASVAEFKADRLPVSIRFSVKGSQAPGR